MKDTTIQNRYKIELLLIYFLLNIDLYIWTQTHTKNNMLQHEQRLSFDILCHEISWDHVQFRLTSPWENHLQLSMIKETLELPTVQLLSRGLSGKKTADTMLKSVLSRYLTHTLILNVFYISVKAIQLNDFLRNDAITLQDRYYFGYINMLY